MKRGNFDERVAKCLERFRAVEAQSSERSERLGLNSRASSSRTGGPGDTPPKV